MKFYRAKKNYSNKFDEIIKNELITERELEKYYKDFSKDLFEIVEVKKNNTYKFFGARFEIILDKEEY